MFFNNGDALHVYPIIFNASILYNGGDDYTSIYDQRVCVYYTDTIHLDITKCLCHILRVLCQYMKYENVRTEYVDNIDVRFGYMLHNSCAAGAEYNIKYNDFIDFDSIFKKITIFKYSTDYRFYTTLNWPDEIGFDIDTKDKKVIKLWEKLVGDGKCVLHETKNGYHAYMKRVNISLIMDIIKNSNQYRLDPKHIALQLIKGTNGFVFTEQWRIANDSCIYNIEDRRLPLDVNFNFKTYEFIEAFDKNQLYSLINTYNYDYICNAFGNKKIFYNHSNHSIILHDENGFITNDERIVKVMTVLTV